MAIDRDSGWVLESYGSPSGLNHDQIVGLYRERDLLMPDARTRDARVGENVSPRVLEIENQVVAANMRLVIAIARRYVRPGTDILDLVQWGSIGLMRAAQKFDVEYGCSFSTYAHWMIREQISREMLQSTGTARIPPDARRKLARFLRIKNAFRTQFSRDPNHLELIPLLALHDLHIGCHGVEETLQILLNLEALSSAAFSLDAPIDGNKEGDGDKFHQLRADPDAVDPFRDCLRNELSKVLGEIFLAPHLTDDEKRVLKGRFLTNPPFSLRDLADEMKITYEKAAKIQVKALSKLKKHEKSKLTPFLDR